MFVRHCTACEQDQLIFPSMISRVEGELLRYTCWCGAEQTMSTAELAGEPRLAAA